MVSSTPRPHFTPGKDPVPIVQEAGWATGPVWTGGKSRLHRDSIPDRPVRSSVTVPLSYPAHVQDIASLIIGSGIRSAGRKVTVRNDACLRDTETHFQQFSSFDLARRV